MEQLSTLNNSSANGLWKIGDGTDETDGAGVVVFDYCTSKLAFLLVDYDYRPAYTCMDLKHVNLPAVYDGRVALAPSHCRGFYWGSASIGQLKVRRGRGFISSLDVWGHPIDLEIAPYEGKPLAYANAEYSWQLLSRRAILQPGDEEDVVFCASGTQSWLNEWHSPAYDYVCDHSDDDGDD